MSVHPIRFENSILKVIDQKLLPHAEVVHEVSNLEGTYIAIKEMQVRGAPLIGFTALYGLGFWIKNHKDFNLDELTKACDHLKKARPTAVNLAFELDDAFPYIQELHQSNLGHNEIAEKVFELTQKKIDQLDSNNQKMANFANDWLLEKYGDRSLNLMTICNTGRLACGSMGTALGVIEECHKRNKLNNVIVPETRPYLQGSRLTSYELYKMGINHQIIVEGAFSNVLGNKMVDAIFVGADRIAANGDTANKVGTSTLSIIASHYNIPIFTVAPLTSFDLECENGSFIEIELRSDDEIKMIKNEKISHRDVNAYNPSFDITSFEHLTGIICEKGIFDPKIKNLKEQLNV
ncbi:MAG: S-methyl-5-thioribose-1-phosphate isomerase [Bacteriovoracaceae bacterium]